MNRAACSSRSEANSEESGVVLVWTALLLFALFALFASSLDLGLARLTQAQMQVAVDIGARDGVAFRDVFGDVNRRDLAALAIQRQFDDDLDPANGDAIGYGMGPALTIVEQDPQLAAGGRIVIDAARVVDPQPQPNTANLREGDLVAGVFDPFDVLHVEASDYQRTDYEVAPAAGGATAPAFLARLRRTRLDRVEDRQPGVSSAAPPIPWLFARGGVLDVDSRRRGIEVRATAIAEQRPALSVSGVRGAGAGAVPVGVPRLPAVAFVLQADPSGADPLAAIAAGSSLSLSIDPGDPTLRLTGAPAGSAGLGWLAVAQEVLRVGATAPVRPVGSAEVVDLTPLATPEVVVVAVVSATPLCGGSEPVIVGFREVAVQVLGADTVSLAPRASRVLPWGVSAADPVAWTQLAGCPDLAASVQARIAAAGEPVLASALAR